MTSCPKVAAAPAGADAATTIRGEPFHVEASESQSPWPADRLSPPGLGPAAAAIAHANRGALLPHRAHRSRSARRGAFPCQCRGSGRAELDLFGLWAVSRSRRLSRLDAQHLPR